MAASNKKFHYTIAKILHWSVGFIIVFNLLSGWRLDDFTPGQKHVLIMIHSGIGTAVFMLMLLRLWWRRSRKLYAPPRWWQRPSMVLQVIFYPLILIQPVIGVLLAAFIDYEVLAFGFINYSAIAADSENLHTMFLQWHGNLALLIIFLVLLHGLERSKKLFIE